MSDWSNNIRLVKQCQTGPSSPVTCAAESRSPVSTESPLSPATTPTAMSDWSNNIRLVKQYQTDQTISDWSNNVRLVKQCQTGQTMSDWSNNIRLLLALA